MKKIYLFLFGLVLLSNCEDPIDITLNNNTEILVVEAYINWVKESQIVEQGVILSLSSGYFESNYKAANNAKVSIEDEIGNVINFFEKEIIEDFMNLIDEPEIPQVIDFKHAILLSSLDFHPNPWILNYIARNTK